MKVVQRFLLGQDSGGNAGRVRNGQRLPLGQGGSTDYGKKHVGQTSQWVWAGGSRNGQCHALSHESQSTRGVVWGQVVIAHCRQGFLRWHAFSAKFTRAGGVLQSCGGHPGILQTVSLREQLRHLRHASGQCPGTEDPHCEPAHRRITCWTVRSWFQQPPVTRALATLVPNLTMSTPTDITYSFYSFATQVDCDSNADGRWQC